MTLSQNFVGGLARGLLLASGVVLLLGTPGDLRADLLIGKDGTETQGELVALDTNTLRFRDRKGEEVQLPRTELARLELYRDLSGTEATTQDQIQDPILREAMEYVADPETYPDAGAVNLYLGYEVRYDADWKSQVTIRNVVRVLRERGKDEGTVAGTWLRDAEDFHFDFGRTYLPDGTVKGLTDKGVRVSAVNTSQPEYDRQMRQLQTLPAVDVGSVVDWQFTRTGTNQDPFLPPYYQFIVRLSEPILRGRLCLRLHRSLEYDLVLTKTQGVTRRRSQEGDYVVETFEWVGLEPGPREDSTPPGAEIYPTVYLAPRKSWEEISTPLREAVEEARQVGPLATELLAKLVPEGSTPEQAYSAIAQWVAREIRLVGVSLEDYRFAPRSLEEILSTGTGNYLDKTMALHGLLRAAKVECELYLGRDRYRSPMPEGVRSLDLFDQALVRVRLDGKWLFRDVDSQDLGPFLLPSPFHDTMALRISGDEPTTELTPVEGPPLEEDLDLIRYHTTLESDGTLVGQRDLVVRGNNARTVRSYRNLSADQLRKRMESLNHSFHPSSELLGYELRNLADFTQDVSYQRRFRVPGYALRAGGKLLAFRLPGLEDSAHDVGNSTRREPLAFLSREQEETEIEVQLPEGFRVLYLPDPPNVEGPGYHLRSSLEEREGRIRFHSLYQRTAYRISAEDYPAYKRMREARAQLARQWIVVEREN